MRKIKSAVTFILIWLAVVLAVGAMSFLTAMLLEVAESGMETSLLAILAWSPPLVVLAFMPVVGAMLFLLRRAQSLKNVPGETELVQTLARRANEMSQRLEAVETILLDRSDCFRETPAQQREAVGRS